MKILIITKNWLGDILFEEPAMRMVRRKYPDADIVCMAPPRCREILERNPGVSRIFEFDERGAQKSFFEKIRFIFRLRREKFDKAFLFHRSQTRAFLLWLGGVKERTGYKKKSGLFLTQAVPEPSAPMHHVDYFIELLTAAGFEKPEPAEQAYRYYFSKEDQERALRTLQQHGISEPYVCFHLGANWEPKRWPTEYFAALADAISAKIKGTVVLTGGRGDAKLAAEVLSKVKAAQPVDLTGRTTLGELAAVFSRSLFVVSGDSGPMHIASGSGARVAALFGPTNPDLTGPRGTGETLVLSYVPEGYYAPWFGKEMPGDGWLSKISPQQVLAALEEKNWFKDFRQNTGSFAKREIIPAKEGNVLVVTLSNIGDVILTTPVITAVAQQYPKAAVTVVCGPKAAPLLSGSGWIDKLVVYDKKASLLKKWRFLQELRRANYECAVDLRNSAIPFLISAKKRSSFLRKFSAKQMRARHSEVLAQMGLPSSPAPVFDFYHADDEARIMNKLKYKGASPDRPWILISPAAASSVKSWKLEGFKEVIQKLLETQDADIVLAGEASSAEACRTLAALDRRRIFNMAGETSLRELAALVSRSRLILANDSAVMHLAYELSRPVVSLFGPTDHEKYGRSGPIWKIVRKDEACVPNYKAECGVHRTDCFQQLEAQKVFEACREVLAASGAGSQKVHV